MPATKQPLPAAPVEAELAEYDPTEDRAFAMFTAIVAARNNPADISPSSIAHIIDKSFELVEDFQAQASVRGIDPMSLEG